MQPMTIPQQLEALQMEKAAIEQLMQHHGWAVFQKRIGYGIENYTELLLTSNLDQNRTQAARERVLAYRELLNLPVLIAEQIEQLEKQSTEGN